MVTTGKPLSSLGKVLCTILMYLLSPPASLVGALSLAGTVCPQMMLLVKVQNEAIAS